MEIWRELVESPKSRYLRHYIDSLKYILNRPSFIMNL